MNKAQHEQFKVLELHQTMNIDSATDVMRVCGGWLYTSVFESAADISVSSTFVPEPPYCNCKAVNGTD